jgi:chromosome segregation ATPase
LAQMQQESGPLQGQLKTLEAIRKKQEKEIQTLTTNLSGNKSTVQILQEEAQVLQEVLQRKEKEITNLNKANQVLESQVQSLQKRKEKEITNLNEITQEVLQRKEKEITNLKETIQGLESQVQSLQKRKEKEITNLKEITQEILQKKEKEITNLSETIQLLESQVQSEDMTTKQSQNNLKIDQITGRNSELENNLKDMKMEQTDLRQKMVWLDGKFRQMITQHSREMRFLSEKVCEVEKEASQKEMNIGLLREYIADIKQYVYEQLNKEDSIIMDGSLPRNVKVYIRSEIDDQSRKTAEDKVCILSETDGQPRKNGAITMHGRLPWETEEKRGNVIIMDGRQPWETTEETVTKKSAIEINSEDNEEKKENEWNLVCRNSSSPAVFFALPPIQVGSHYSTQSLLVPIGPC